jgi:hypothetical protein
VQHHPHAVALVHAELEEVVPRTQGAELLRGPVHLVVRQLGGRAVRRQPALGVLRDRVVTAPHPRRDRVLDAAEQRLERAGSCSSVTSSWWDHAAADVDTDRRRDHRSWSGSLLMVAPS